MRRLAIAIAAVLSVGAPAGAVEVGQGSGTGTVKVVDSTPADVTRTPPTPAAEVEPVSTGGGGSARPAPAARWYRYDVILWDPASRAFCVDPRWTRDQAYAERQGRVGFDDGRFDTADAGRPRPNCPEPAAAAANRSNGNPPPPAPPAPATEAQIAADVWQHVEDLPRPTVTVQPKAYAITGKKVYLQISGPQTWTRTIDNPIGDDVVITATSDYVIDWGDPTDEASRNVVTTSQGGPYPDGDVTHVYVEKSPRTTITVTQRWTATWQAGARTGTLSQLTTAADPPVTIEVRDLQAVRQR